MSGDSDSVAPEESPRTLGGYFVHLSGPVGLGLVVLLYVVVGGLAWVVIRSQDSGRAAPTAASPLPASKPTLVPEPTAIPTAVPAPVVQPAPTAVVQQTQPQPPQSSYLIQPPAQGKFVLIDQDRQTMLLFENGTEVQRYPISSGVPGSRLTNTPSWTGHISHYVGTFFAYGGYADNAWYLFQDLGDILIHSAPYIYVDGRKVYQDLDKLGQAPSSHGCIRMSPEAIEQLGLWGPKGTLVHITPWTGNGPARLAAGS